MSVDKGVNHTHNKRHILEPSWKDLSDEVVKQMASTPGSGDEVVHCSARESQARHDIQLCIFVLHRPCGIAVPCTCRCKEHEELQWLIEGGSNVLHSTSSVRFVP